MLSCFTYVIQMFTYSVVSIFLRQNPKKRSEKSVVKMKKQSQRSTDWNQSRYVVSYGAHSSACLCFPWCFGWMSQGAEGLVCPGFCTNSESPGPFHLCSLELDPERDGFLSRDHVVIKIPTNSSFSTIYNTWRRSCTLKRKGNLGILFSSSCYLDKSTIDLSGG